MILRPLALLLLWCITVAHSHAQDYADEHNFVEVWLEPAKAAVGQHITLNVMVGVDSYFTGPTDLGLPDIDHALVLNQQRALNGGKRLGGKYFTTQTHKIDIYPGREGILLLPSFPVQFVQAMEIDGDFTNVTVQLNSEQLLGLIQTPAAMAGTSGYMVSGDVTITDEWSGAQDNDFEVGDVLTRVVTVTAADMPSMNMPQIAPHSPPGVSVTLAEPTLSSSSGREAAAAVMAQHISYAIESPGQYQLGGETLSWWNPETAQREDHLFAVAPIDAGGLPWRLLAIAAGGAVTVLLAALLIRFYLRRRDPEDLKIKQQLRSAHAPERFAALYAYADYHQPDHQQPARLRQLLSSSDELLEKVMTSRFSANKSDNHPSRQESRSLYRQLKKTLRH